jgi:hypothetical protein
LGAKVGVCKKIVSIQKFVLFGLVALFCLSCFCFVYFVCFVCLSGTPTPDEYILAGSSPDVSTSPSIFAVCFVLVYRFVYFLWSVYLPTSILAVRFVLFVVFFLLLLILFVCLAGTPTLGECVLAESSPESTSASTTSYYFSIVVCLFGCGSWLFFCLFVCLFYLLYLFVRHSDTG